MREGKILEYGIILSDKLGRYQELLVTSLSPRYVLSFSKNVEKLNELVISGNLSFIAFDVNTKRTNIACLFNLISSLYNRVSTFLISENTIKEDVFLQIERFIKYKIDECFCINSDIDKLINILRCLPKKDIRHAKNITEIYSNIIGKSQNIQNLRLFVSKAAKHDYPVLLSGKIGLRKSAIAKLIHDISKRNAKNFIKIEIGAIPENLIESVLFGGTRVETARTFDYGLISRADKGTLFLNEIEKASAYMQGKLLKFLETKRIRRAGDKAEMTYNFKLICATNCSLKEMVREGKFRQDLYYKLSVQSFYLLELDKRKEDIPLLVEYYCKKNNFKITDSAIDKLVLHRWTGNVRELFNTLDHSFVEAHALKIIYPEDIHLFGHVPKDRE